MRPTHIPYYKRSNTRVNTWLTPLLYVCVAHTHEPNPRVWVWQCTGLEEARIPILEWSVLIQIQIWIQLWIRFLGLSGWRVRPVLISQVQLGIRPKNSGLGLIFRGQSLLPSRLGLELSMRALVVDFRSGSQGLKGGFLLRDNSYGTKNGGNSIGAMADDQVWTMHENMCLEIRNLGVCAFVSSKLSWYHKGYTSRIYKDGRR